MNQNKALHNRLRRLEAIQPNRLLIEIGMPDGTKQKGTIDDLERLENEGAYFIRCLGGNSLDDLDKLFTIGQFKDFKDNLS